MTDNVTGDRLRSFVDRLETLADERQGVQDQIKEVFGEAKSEGFDVKIIRTLLRLRKMKPHERVVTEELLAVYKAALGMAT